MDSDDAVIKACKGIIRDEAETLIDWARQADVGGWSTQHVEPMRRRAMELLTFLARLPK